MFLRSSWELPRRHSVGFRMQAVDILPGAGGLKTLVASELGGGLWGSSTCPANCVDGLP